MNLLTDDITVYSITNSIPDLSHSLCNQCSGSVITTNPSNPSELFIYPDHPEPKIRYSREARAVTDYAQYKLTIKDTNCTISEVVGFSLVYAVIQSNIGILDFGKIVYCHDDKLVFIDHAGSFLGESLQITKDSELKNWQTIGFYQTEGGLVCVAAEPTENSFYSWKAKTSIFDVAIDEERLTVR